MLKQICLALGCFSLIMLTSCAKQTPLPIATTSSAYPDHNSDTKGSNVFPTQRSATGNRVFIFDPQNTAWAAYDENGNRVKTGRASGGQKYCADVGRACKTAIGQFQVYHKKGYECESSIYPLGEGGAPMPYCMFFHKGYAIHGSPYVPDYNASHGCIRVTPSAAQWLNNNFIQNGTTVIVRPYG